VRHAEGRVAHLELHVGRLERLLALAATCAVRGTDVSPEALIAVLEDVDREASA
jgi:hypothetical protein